eukprot:TRINITY_DN4719_c0_g2_i1.p1 TRINITY_DN4719_c0_g2~~TRINITY_DN4719_c0_g2_i1.p1  ORF type:complete len:709 (+),score=182.33 TRINITY_DN4719_c0_g2_i1:442-2568(+)
MVRGAACKYCSNTATHAPAIPHRVANYNEMSQPSDRLVVPSSKGDDYIGEGCVLNVDGIHEEEDEEGEAASVPSDFREAVGTVVGVKGGVVGLSTAGCDYVTVIERKGEEVSVGERGPVLVKMSVPAPIGSWLVPSGDDDGYAVMGPASHKQSFARVVDHSEQPDMVWANLKPPAERSNERTYLLESVRGVNTPPSEVPATEKPRSFALFIILVIGAVIASIIVFINFIPNHGQDKYNLTCNNTAAILCSDLYGEFDNRCHAVHSGIADSTTLGRCCSSGSAYNCFKQAFCDIPCEQYSSLLAMRVGDNMNETAIAQGVAEALGLLESNVSVSEGNMDTTLIGLPLTVYYNTFMNEASTEGSELRGSVNMVGVPWAVGSDGVVGSVLADEFRGWHASPACEISTAFGQNCAGYFYCFYCSARMSYLRQSINIDLYPPTTQWTFSGMFAAKQESKSHKITPVVTLTFYSSSPTGLKTMIQPGMMDPTALDTWWPTYLPFYWSGMAPEGTAEIEVSIGCEGDEGVCSYYYSGVTLSPGPPPCSGVNNCHYLKCTEMFNETHSICLSTRSCRVVTNESLPYDVLADASDIEGYFVGGLFDEVRLTVGGTISGNFTSNVSSEVQFIEVYDVSNGNELLPSACPYDAFYCVNLNFNHNISEFRYNFLLSTSMNDIPPIYHRFRLKSNESAHPAVCTDIAWYAAEKPPHVMDIT